MIELIPLRARPRTVERAGGLELPTGNGGGVPSPHRHRPQHHSQPPRPHGTFENDAAMKTRITARQGPEDFLVLNAKTRRRSSSQRRPGRRCSGSAGKADQTGRVRAWGERPVYSARRHQAGADVARRGDRLKGVHNVENVLAAVCAARLGGVPAESIRASVANFKAVEHRLSMWPRCAAWSITTTPRPPTWTRPGRRWRRSRVGCT